VKPRLRQERFFGIVHLHLQYVNELCPLLLVLIRRDHIAVMPLQTIWGRIHIEEIDQPIKHLFRQFLALLIEAFFVFLHREADHGVLPHKDMFFVGAGDEAVAGFTVGGVHKLLIHRVGTSRKEYVQLRITSQEAKPYHQIKVTIPTISIVQYTNEGRYFIFFKHRCRLNS
jgi:hypothetical protein